MKMDWIQEVNQNESMRDVGCEEYYYATLAFRDAGEAFNFALSYIGNSLL